MKNSVRKYFVKFKNAWEVKKEQQREEISE